MVTFKEQLAVRSMRGSMRQSRGELNDFLRLIVVKVLIMVFNLFKGKSGSIVVHVVFDLSPVAEAPHLVPCH